MNLNRILKNIARKTNKFLFISTFLFVVFSFSPVSTNFNELPEISKIYAVSNLTQEQLDQTASILSSIQNIINQLKIDIQKLFGREVKAQADITTGLVGHWKFDEGAGTIASDSSGNNNTGSLVNGPAWTTGKIGGALSFDGINDYVNVGTKASLQMSSEITVAAWIYPKSVGIDSGNGDIIINKEGEYEIARFSDGTIQFAIANISPGWAWVNTGYVAPLNTWAHLMWTYSASNGQLKLYVNGVEKFSMVGSGTIGDAATSQNDFRIGNREISNQPFNGLIDDVRVYNRALTQAEITELYNYTGEWTPPPVDTTPPALSVGSPTGALLSGTTQTTMSLTTNENATCKYGTVPNTAYASIVPPAGGTFTTTGGISHSSNFIGLTNGTSYNYYVRCQDTAGNANLTDYPILFSVASSIVSDTQAPTTPTGLIISAISSSQINLSWTASTDNVGVAGYKIYRCSGSGCAPTTQIATSAINSYSDTGLIASTAYTYNVSAYDMAGNEGGKSIQTSATTQVSSTNPIDNLSDNSWIYLNPQLSKRYKAIYQNPSATANQTLADMIETREPAFREFSGIIHGDGKIFYFGGGHTGYAGNDVEVYDIVNNIWTQSYKPEVPPADDPVYGSGGTGNISPTGKPYTRHTYSSASYDPILKRYLLTAAYDNLASYDPRTNQWNWIAGRLAPGGQPPYPDMGYGHLTQLDSALGGILGIGRGGIWLWKDGVWASYDNVNVLLDGVGGSASVYIPDIQSHLFAVMPQGNCCEGYLQGHLYLYHSISKTVTEITSVPNSLKNQFNPEGNFVMAYDSTNKKVIALSAEDKSLSGASKIQVWVYDPMIDNWDQLPISASSPLRQGFSAMNREPLQYDPIHNAFILVDKIGDKVQTWAYRYKKVSSVPDTQAPTTSTGLTATAVSSSQINLSWTAFTDNVGVVGYKIYRCAGSACAPTVQIATSATNSYSNIGLTASTAYAYAVSAYDAAGNESAKSTNVSATTQNALTGGSISIPITIEEPAGIARTNEPITSGVPLPQGTQTTSWSLWDGNTEIPLQTTKLQGRTSWILLDFQTSVLANSKKTLTLKDTASTILSSKPIIITEDASQITVDNKIIKTKLSKTNFNLFEEVWLDKNNNGAFEATEQIITPQTDNIQIIDSTTGQTFSGKGIPDKILWEYQGPMRSTLRVDGRFKNTSNQEFIAYTTRLTFYAGRTDVKIEHILRNSYQPNERHVKVKSATIKIGPGTTQLRANKSNSLYWSNVGIGGVTLKVLPTTMGISGYVGDFDVDQNGGWLLPDLTHESRTFVVDFSEGLSSTEQVRRANAIRSSLFAMVTPSWYSQYGELSTTKFSTLDDEKQSYQKWGWTWTPEQEPKDSHKPDYLVWWWPSIHDDSEADDVWQNLFMYLRTSSRGYLDRATGWAWYQKYRYPRRTDGFDYNWKIGAAQGPGSTAVDRPLISIPLTSTDQAYLNNEASPGRAHNDHMYGWGLIDYYYLTGDKGALEAAIDLGEMSYLDFAWRKIEPDNYNITSYGLRDDGRNLLLASRLWEATQDPKWRGHMDHIAQLLIDDDGSGVIDDWDARGSYLGPRNDHPDKPKTVSPFENGILAHGMYRYFQLTGNTIIRDKLIKMAEFGMNYALHPTYDFTGYFIAMDYPNPGDFWHQNFDAVPVGLTGFDPLYTTTWIDLFVSAYRITGNQTFLDRAKHHWDRASKARYGDPLTRTAGDNQVGRFVNASFGSGGVYYSSNGDLSYNHLLFYDYARVGVVSDTTSPATPTNLAVIPISSSQILLSWTASTDNVAVVGYKIYRCSGAGCVPTVQIATSLTNSYSNTGLIASTAYTYAVSAYDAAGNNSSQSSSVSATTQSLTPQCSDTTDNDSDGKIDFGGVNPDPDCSSLTDNNESDTTSPTISSVISTTLASTTARINWTTNEPATSQVEYGFTTQYGAPSTLDSTLTTSHSVSLSNLSPDNTTYNFRVRSKDSSNNESISINNTFITPGLTDIIPPASTTNLKANNITQTSVDLVTWTASGDDGNSGTASQFDVRYSAGELTENNWNNGGVIRATGEPTPKPAGSVMNYTLVGLTPNTTYKVALKTLDEILNQSLISNIITFTTLATQTTPQTTSPSSGSSSSSSSGGGSTSSSGGGGGGGGGSFILSDTTPPPLVTNLESSGADKQTRLTWNNPVSSDYVRTIIVRKELTSATTSSTSSPQITHATSTKDGTIIYEGTDKEFTDIKLKNNETYLYSIFTIDRVPNYSSPATTTVKTIQGKMTAEIEKKEPTSQPSLKQATIIKPTFTIKKGFFKRNLKQGMKGEDVKKLQEILYQNKTEFYEECKQEFSIFNLPTGQAGFQFSNKSKTTNLKSQTTNTSKCSEQELITGYFGPITKLALIRFQEKHKEDILTPNNLKQGTGFFGKATIKKIEEMYAQNPKSEILNSKQITKEQTEQTETEDKQKAVPEQKAKELKSKIQELIKQLMGKIGEAR